jgi:hypothetical protein
MSTIWSFGGPKPAHPYYPLDAKFAATYVPNKSSPSALVALISSAFAVVILGSWGALKLYRPQLLANERWIAVWFILCKRLHLRVAGLTRPGGVLHTTFEGIKSTIITACTNIFSILCVQLYENRGPAEYSGRAVEGVRALRL